jgi:hypothetical protein
MFGRRKVSAPDLAMVTIPVFTPDDRGAALFHGITNEVAGTLNSAVRIDARGDGSWGGWTQAPHTVLGATARLGTAKPVVEAGATIDQERALTSPVQRIFAQRMAARDFS